MPFFSAADGTRLHYDAVGDGPALLCQPGGPGRAAAYLEDLGGLAASRRLVLLDGRATGRSDLPSDPARLAFPVLAEDLVALMDHLDLPRADVLAHSAGAIVAQALLAAAPNRVNRLVLVTPSGRLQGDYESDIEAIRAARSDEDWYPQAAEAARALAEQTGPGRTGGPGSGSLMRATRPFFYGAWGERQQRHAATADSQTSRRAELGFRPGEFGGAARSELLRAVGGYPGRVLVVAGSRDGLTGVASARAVVAALPNAELVVLDGAGHFPWVDLPAGFAAAVETFLGSPG